MIFRIFCCLSTLLVAADVPKVGAPATFTGGVGSFRVACSVDHATIRTDQTLRLTLEITGEGDLSAASAPSLKQWPDLLDDFQPTGDPDTKRQPNGVAFVYSLKPQRAGVLTIAPLRLTFYHPERRRFETTATKSLQVQVEPAARIGPEAVIQPEAGGAESSVSAVLWATAAAFLIFSASGAAIWLLRRREQPEAAKPKSAIRPVAARKFPVTRDDRAGEQEPVARAYTQLRRAAGMQLGRDCGSMTTEELVQAFRDHGLSEERLLEMQRILQAADRARFARGERDSSELVLRIQELAETLHRRTQSGESVD